MLTFQDNHVPNIATLCFIVDEKNNRILLGRKQRGHCEGKLNGFGGKAEWSDTSLIHTITREVKEECNVDIHNADLRAIVRFHPKLQTKELLTGYIYIATEWSGDPRDSEEMKVEWYDLENMPYAHMWEDDSQWVPLLLEGKKVFVDLYHSKDSKARMEYRDLEKADCN